MKECTDTKQQELLKKFNRYNNGRRKELKRVDLVAVEAGFKRAWRNHDYSSITAVGSRINEEVLHQHPKLVMFVEMAITRSTY